MVKSFIITDDVGTPLYLDHELDDEARMVCMQLAATQDLMATNFNQGFRSFSTPSGLQAVMHRVDSLLLIVLSDNGEAIPSLHRELQLIHGMMVFVFGNNMLRKLRSPRQADRRKANALLKQSLDALIHFTAHEQAFLVQSVERLEVNDDLRARCCAALHDAVEKGDSSFHGLLFVGSKLVAQYSKARVFELLASDVAHITLYFHSAFFPKERSSSGALRSTAPPPGAASNAVHPPLSPISSPDGGKRGGGGEGGGEGGMDGGEGGMDGEGGEGGMDGAGGGGGMGSSSLSCSASSSSSSSSSMRRGTTTEATNIVSSSSSAAGGGKNAGGAGPGEMFFTPHDSIAASLARNIHVNTLNLAGVGNFKEPADSPAMSSTGYSTPVAEPSGYGGEGDHQGAGDESDLPFRSASGLFQSALDIPALAEEEGGDDGGEDDGLLDGMMAGGMVGGDDDDDDDDGSEVFTDARGVLATPREGNGGGRGGFGGGVGGREEESGGSGVDSLHETVFLQVGNAVVPGRMYAALIAPNTSLVLISERVSAEEAESEAAHAASIRRGVERELATFIDFLVIKAQAHITMLSYLYHFPGMVHFIYVDRTHDYVIAPTITPLHGDLAGDLEGSSGPSSSSIDSPSVAMIKSAVWDLARSAHKALAEGYTSMAMYKNGFCYWYDLVAENADGEPLPLSLPCAPHEAPPSVTDLKALIARQHPTVRHVRCYELYALYVGSVPLESVAASNAGLLSMVREDRSLRMLRTLEHYNVSW